MPVLLAAGVCIAQEQPAAKGGKEEPAGEAEDGGLEIWKWANFLVLAGGIGYLIKKNAGPYFAARSANILREMDEAKRQSAEARTRAAEVDRLLANLEAQIAELRAENERELKAGAERIRQQTAEELARIEHHIEQDIARSVRSAHADLKRHSAELAVDLAEKKVRARMTPVAQEMLVENFARELR
jgi:F-type H+-transporting ATPase subunit b